MKWFHCDTPSRIKSPVTLHHSAVRPSVISKTDGGIAPTTRGPLRTRGERSALEDNLLNKSSATSGRDSQMKFISSVLLQSTLLWEFVCWMCFEDTTRHVWYLGNALAFYATQHLKYVFNRLQITVKYCSCEIFFKTTRLIFISTEGNRTFLLVKY